MNNKYNLIVGDSYQELISMMSAAMIAGWQPTGGVMFAGKYFQAVVTDDDTAPTITSITIENATPTKLIIVFDELMDEAVMPDFSTYSIVVSGEEEEPPTPIVIDSTWINHHLVLTTDTTYVSTDVVTFSYTQPVSDGLRDGVGNLLVSAADVPVQNNVEEV